MAKLGSIKLRRHLIDKESVALLVMTVAITTASICLALTSKPSQNPTYRPKVVRTTDKAGLSSVLAATTQSAGSINGTPAGNNGPMRDPATSHNTNLGSVLRNNATATEPNLIMSPSTIVLGNNYSPTPRIYMSNGIEISEPSNNDSSDLALSWFDDGQGHFAAGPYYLGWKPLILRKHPDGDGQTTFKVSVQDRAGNTYSTGLKVVWLAPRYLGMSIGSVSKSVVGNNTIFTGHVLFNPTANVGSPIINISASAYFNGTDRCDIGESNSTFIYTGQASYDVTCTVSASTLNQYPGGFDIGVNAGTQWPPQDSVIFPTQFHTN